MKLSQSNKVILLNVLRVQEQPQVKIKPQGQRQWSCFQQLCQWGLLEPIIWEGDVNHLDNGEVAGDIIGYKLTEEGFKIAKELKMTKGESEW